MSKLSKQNLQHIKLLFEAQTGVDLNSSHREHRRQSTRLVIIFAAVLVFSLSMLAFSQKLFTPLDGDKLSLAATYEGNGIVCIQVKNDSDKKLTFQKQAKLIRWVTGEEVLSNGGTIQFHNTVFPPHSAGTMTIDLSAAYDIPSLEQAKTNTESYYLLLTNNSFLFGHDWICSFRFTPYQQSRIPDTDHGHISVPAQQMDTIEEELQFYFADSYTDAPLALQEAHFQYQQKVDELLKRSGKDVVCSLSPTIMVAGPSEYLEPEPMLRDIPEGVVFDPNVALDQQRFLTSWTWTHADGYGRLISTAGEQALSLTAFLPQHPENKKSADGGVALPLIFHMVFDADRASDFNNYAFLYGHLFSFAELEQYKILHDEHYAIYDITDLIYTDVDAYLDFFLTTRKDVYCDEDIRSRVHSIYDYYRDKQAVAQLYYYRE